MIITRNGQTIEITKDEMMGATEEFEEILHEQKVQQLIDLHQKTLEWENYVTAQRIQMPYPQNLLLALLPDEKAGKQYLERSIEEQTDILNGLHWAVNTLPDKNRIAIESWYRDKAHLYACADKLNCTIGRFADIRDKGLRKLKDAIRFNAYHLGYQRFSLLFPNAEDSENAKQKKNLVRSLKPHSYTDYDLQFTTIQQIGLSMASCTALLQRDIITVSDLVNFLINHSITEIPDMTPQIREDVLDAISFVQENLVRLDFDNLRTDM